MSEKSERDSEGDVVPAIAVSNRRSSAERSRRFSGVGGMANMMRTLERRASNVGTSRAGSGGRFDRRDVSVVMHSSRCAHEAAIAACGLHVAQVLLCSVHTARHYTAQCCTVPQGGLVWAAYRELEAALLAVAQPGEETDRQRARLDKVGRSYCRPENY